MKRKIILFPLLAAVLFAGIMSCGDTEQIVNTNTTNLWIRLDSTTGQDAYITDFYNTTNFKNDPDFGGIAWCVDTTCTMPYIGRTLFRFYLSNIPANATVTSATLLLTHNPSCLHSPSPGHRNNGGSNACLIQRISTSWNDSTVTWNNQPAAVTLNQVNVPASTSEIENYTINITGFINDMVRNPSTNNGLLFRLETESPLRSLNFASGNNADSTIRPLILITYTN